MAPEKGELGTYTFKLEDLNCYRINLHEDENEDSDSFEVWAEMYEKDSIDHMFHIGDACVAQIPNNMIREIEEI